MNDEHYLNERVQVIALFGEGLDVCRPLRFKRANGRVVIVSELGLRHPDHRGTRAVHVFDVTDGAADYRLELDAERLAWHLTREGDHYEG